MRTKMMQCVPASNCRNTRGCRDWGWHLAKPPWRGLGCPQILPFPKRFWGSALGTIGDPTEGFDGTEQKAWMVQKGGIAMDVFIVGSCTFRSRLMMGTGIY